MKRRIRTGIIILCVLTTLCSFGRILAELIPEWGAEKAVSELRKQTVLQNVSENENEKETEPELTLSMEELKAVNPDIAGWIYIPGTVVDYPVLKGADTEYYLTHAYDGSYSRTGSVFTLPGTSEELADRHMFLFAHRTSSGRMFSDLKNYEDEAYAAAHPVYLYTKAMIRKYEAAAYYECSTTHLTFQEGSEPEAYAAMIRESADWYSPELTAGTDELKILTLATCPKEDSKHKRVIVQCILTEEEQINEKSQ